MLSSVAAPRCFARWTIPIVLAALGGGPGIPSQRAEPRDEEPYRMAQGGCPAWFQAEQERLAEIAGRLQMPAAQATIDAWEIPFRSDATVLYLPVPWESENTADPRADSFARAWNAARKKLADDIYAAALNAAESGLEEIAYRLLWRTLRENPDHDSARAAIGSAATGLRAAPRIARGRAPETNLGWPAQSYLRAVSPHFELLSRADRPTTLQTAQRLEQVYALWSQLFYPVWSQPGTLAGRLRGSAPSPPGHQRMHVYLLKDRQEYLETLGVAEQNIDLSIGYYHPQRRMSFFYPAPGWEETLFHELTHQMFIEVADGNPETGNQHSIWMVEGVALYMESLEPHGTFWTVGGVDAARVQTARYRGVRDGFWPPWDAFHAGGLDVWKRDPALPQLYTHAVGLTHVFLDRLGRDERDAFLNHLRATYLEGATTEPLRSILGTDETTAKNRYQDLLILQNEDVRVLHQCQARPTELVACGSRFDPTAWSRFGNIVERCEWLDVSFSNATDADLQWLDQLRELRRLSLEGTRVGRQTVARSATLPKLRELDLTGCTIDDAALLPLARHRTLQTLWLGQTRITSQALETLRTVAQLKRCDLTGTSIPADEIEAFQQFLAAPNR